MNLIESRFRIPIYEVNVIFVVTLDIKAARKEFPELGDVRPESDPMACVAYEGFNFGLFLESPTALTFGTISHEVFHLTHRICEYCCVNFDNHNHEAAAYLNDFLATRIFSLVGELKINEAAIERPPKQQSE